MRCPPGDASAGALDSGAVHAVADVSEFRHRVLMQWPASPFVISNAVRGMWLGAGTHPRVGQIAEYALLFDGQFAAVTPHRTASSVVRQRRWRVAVDRRLAERLLRGAGIEAPARCATCTERQSADPDRLTRGPQAGRRAGRAIRTLPGPVRCGPGGRGCRGRSGSVRAVAACLAVLVWPPAARRLARPGSRRSRLLRWTGPGSAGMRRPATMSTPGRSR